MKKMVSVIFAFLFIILISMNSLAADIPKDITDALSQDNGNFTPYRGGTWVFEDSVYKQKDDMISGSSWHFGSYFNYSYADFTAEYKMKLDKIGDKEGYTGVMFHKTKPNDTIEMSGYCLVLKSYGSLCLQNWTKTKTMSQLPVTDPYAWHSYKLAVTGKNIKIYIDGQLRQSINDNSFASGYFAFTTGTAAASFKDFTITGKALGSADTLGKISDGNMDKAAADTVFMQRAKIGSDETAEEPDWYTLMISKISNGVAFSSDTNTPAYETNKEGIYTGDNGNIVMNETDSSSNTKYENTLKTITIIIVIAAVLLLAAAITLFLIQGKGKKIGIFSLALILSFGIFIPHTISAESFTIREDDYEKVFYVSPQGDDNNSGTIEKPFQSIRKAKNVVKSISKNAKKDIAVVLREGLYTLGSTLTFDETDSGQNGTNILYMSYPGELVTISGGMRVDGWEDAGGGVWKAKTSLTVMRQLYIDGIRATMARSSRIPLELLGYDYKSKKIIVNSEDVKDITGGEILLYQDWTQKTALIKSIDSVSDNPVIKEITLSDFDADCLFTQSIPDIMNSCTKYILQNSKALLDEKGEWYFDAAEQTVYYIPRDSENMKTASVYAPALESVIKIRGTSIENHVKNLVFRGIVFEYSGFNKIASTGFVEYQANHFLTRKDGNTYLMDVPTATIHIENADNIRIERSVIRHSGGCGINVYASASKSTIDGCTVNDISGNGITVSPYATDKLPGNLYLPENPDLTAVHNIDITNNVISWSGQEFKGAVALCNVLGYEILMRNNEIAYAPGCGISNGWGWSTSDFVVKENTIAYNDIHHIGMSVVDLGGIYNLNAQIGTQIRENYIHDIQRAGTGRAGAPVYGLYLDEGTNNMIVTGNSLVNCSDNQEDILFHETGGSIYSLGNDYSNAVVKNSGVGKAYRSISLKKQSSVGTSLVSNTSLSQAGEGFNGEIGMRITPKKDIVVKALGRFYMYGNSEIHQLTIYNATDGNMITEVSINMAQGTADYNGFKYISLPKSVLLKKDVEYFITSSEKKGGDLWLERMCKVISNESVSVNGNVIKTDNEFTAPLRPGTGYTAGPVNLLFEKQE